MVLTDLEMELCRTKLLIFIRRQKLPRCRDKLFLLEEKFGMLPEWGTTVYTSHVYVSNGLKKCGRYYLLSVTTKIYFWKVENSNKDKIEQFDLSILFVNKSWFQKNSPIRGYFVFPVQLDSTPSHNNHIILPSGIFIIGIDVWVERFTKMFEKEQ